MRKQNKNNANSILIILLLSLIPFFLFSQKKVDLSGNLGFQLEFYELDAADTSKLARRMPFNYRFFLNPVIKISDKFSIPFNFSISRRQATAILPRPPDQAPIDYIKDPLNNVGIHPTFNWGEFHIGTHVPNYSELSVGNLPIFGVGFDINPGPLRVAASTGYSSWGIKADSLNQIKGIYKRKLQSAKIGLGKKNKSGIYVNYVKAEDIPEDFIESKNLGPEENALLSSNFELKFSSKLSLTGELAGSIFTPNSLEQTLEDTSSTALSFINFLMPPKIGTFSDFGAVSKFAFNSTNFGLSLNFKHLGAGFKSLGFPFQESDIQDITISPRIHLFKNKMILNGELGYRQNNISDTKLNQTTNALISANCNLAISKHLNLNGNYTNFGLENGIEDDTLKVNFISENWSIAANINFKTGTINNIIVLSYNNASFKDLNVVTGINNNNNTNSYLASYSFQKNKFSLTLTGNRIFNNQIIRDLDILALSCNLSYKIDKPKLKISTRFGYNTTHFDQLFTNTQFIIRPSIGWQMHENINLNFSGFFNQFSNDTDPLKAYNETLFSTNLTCNF